MARLLGKTSDINGDTPYGVRMRYYIPENKLSILVAWFSGIITAISAIIIWVYLTI